MTFEARELAGRTIVGPACPEWNAYVVTYGEDQMFEVKELAGCPVRFDPLLVSNEIDPITATEAMLATADDEVVIVQSASDITNCWNDGVARMTVRVASQGTLIDHYVEAPAIDAITQDKACVLRRAYWGDLNGDDLRDLTVFLQGKDCSAHEAVEENPHTALGLCALPVYLFETALATAPFVYVSNDALGHICPFDHICDDQTLPTPPPPRSWNIEAEVTFRAKEAPPPPAGCGVVTGAAFGRPRPSLLDGLFAGFVRLYIE